MTFTLPNPSLLQCVGSTAKLSFACHTDPYDELQGREKLGETVNVVQVVLGDSVVQTAT